MRAVIAKVVVSSALILSALTQSLAQPAEPAVVIVDGRTGVDAPRSESSDARVDAEVRWESSPPVRQAIAAARSYWSAEVPGLEENLRVLGVASGSFTRPDVEQHAVLFQMSNQPRSGPPMGLAIVERDRLVRNIAFVAIAHSVRALPDIDANGRDELSLRGEFVGQGLVSRGIALAEFGDDGLEDFGWAITFESACGAGYGDTGSLAARLSVVPGSEIVVEQYQQVSCESELWEPVGHPEPLQPVSDIDRTVYTEISLDDAVTD